MSDTSPDVSVARWRKYGKDRLYVAYADGTKLGYWDLVADTPHPERPELEELLESTYLRWTAGRLARTSEDSAAAPA